MMCARVQFCLACPENVMLGCDVIPCLPEVKGMYMSSQRSSAVVQHHAMCGWYDYVPELLSQ